jgi:hypothetical protein
MVDMSDQAFYALMEDDLKKLRRLLPDVEKHLPKTGWSNYLLAMPYAYLGDNDKAFELLEKAYLENDLHLSEIKRNEYFDGIRNDPRYLDLLKRLGLDQNPIS